MSEEDQESSVQHAFSPPPPELSGKKPLDFASTVARLEMRAIATRKRARLAGMLLVLGVYGIVGVLSYNLINGERSVKYADLISFRSDSRQTIERPFTKRVAYIMKQLVGPEDSYEAEKVKFVPPNKEAAAALKIELKEALSDLEKAIQIADMGKKSESETGSIAPLSRPPFLALALLES